MQGELGLALARTFVARGIAAVGGVFLVVTLGRLYGAEGVGAFALAQSLYLGAGILSRYGMDHALMRYVGEDAKSEAIRKYLSWAMFNSLRLSVLAAGVIFLLHSKLVAFFEIPMLGQLLPIISFAIPPFTLAIVLGGFMKGIRKPATACLLENGIIALVTSGLLLVLNSLWPVGISNVGWAFTLAAWSVFGYGGWEAWRWFRTQELDVSSKAQDYSDFKKSSNSFFLMSISGLMQNVLSIIIAGWLLNGSDLGLFKAAERLAMLIRFLLFVINAVLPPHFASLYRKGDPDALGMLVRKAAGFGLILASPLLLICVIFPQWALSFFGREFIEAAPLLRILAVAQVISVSTGSLTFLLNMTGNEQLMCNISLICSMAGLLSFLLLIPYFGALGAALALALTLVLQNLVAFVFVWRKLGIWALPRPKFFL